MNSKKKPRVSLHGNISSQHVSSTSQNEPQKHNMISSCRRVGLNRKRNKSLGASQSHIDSSQNKNIFIEEDLRKIRETKYVVSSNVNTSEVSDESIEYNVNNKISNERKRKLPEEENTTSENPVCESSTQEEAPVSEDTQIKKTTESALKIKLASPEKKKESIANTQENKENLPAVDENTLASTDENIVESTNSLEISQTSNVNVSQQNSLEENSDGSDFYPNITRRKKKKVLTTKQRNNSKPSSSQQRQNISSTNNTPSYSDSEDDFVPTPVRRNRNNSIKVECNVKSERDEKKPDKKKIKLKQHENDELNKTGHVRISQHKSYNIIQCGNVVSYVKSFDNDNFKVMESDDNQQTPVRPLVVPKQSMILERHDYIPKCHDSDKTNAEIISEMPSMFTGIMNNLEAAAQDLKESQEKERIYRTYINEKIKKELESKSNEMKFQETPALSSLDEPGPSGLQNRKVSIDTVSPNNTESSSETCSSETQESEISDAESTNKELTNLKNLGLPTMTAEKLSEIKDALQATIKKKQERLESLQRIQVYKETHNLEELQNVTLQIKRGCQRALVDLIASLKEQSNANFTMATLLEYMKIPNELVGYNEDEDNFT